MYVVCVTVYVKPEHTEDFIKATEDNHKNTRCEPGNVRFDVCRHAEDPSRFFLYEVYRTALDFSEHQKTAHYLGWKAAVADWMARPREGVKHQSVFPPDKQW